MKRIKTLLILVLVVAFVVLISGCGMLGYRSAGVDTGSSSIDELPQWLTLAHRAEAAEEPEVDEEEEATEEAAEAPAQVATTQPATTQPATTQPAQTEQQVQQSGTPRWQQPGTMEYIAKMRLDEAVSDYKRLLAKTTSDMKVEERNEHKAKLAAMKAAIDEVAKGLGLDVSKEYGLSASSSDSGLGSGDWFHDMDSPSGWGN